MSIIMTIIWVILAGIIGGIVGALTGGRVTFPTPPYFSSVRSLSSSNGNSSSSFSFLRSSGDTRQRHERCK